MATRLICMKYHSTNVRFFNLTRRAVHGFLNLTWNYTPGVSRSIVKKLFFTPSTYKVTPAEKNYLDNGKPFQIAVHDKMIQCWQWGSGPTILLAHGWNGRGIHLHHFIEPLTRRGYSVIAYDAPGHGESQGNTSSYFEFTDTIRTLLNSSNGYNIQGVIAHSLGGSATVNSIAKENKPLEVVLIAPALRLAEILYSYFDHIGVPKPIYQNLIREYETQFGYNMHRDNPSNLLKEISSKIFIVHDKNDQTIPYVDSKDIAHRFQNVSLYTTERLGHKQILADSSVVNRIIDYFGKHRG